MQYVTLLYASLLILPLKLSKAHPQNHHHNVNHVKRSFGIPGDGQSFDYVVIGGGTAGLTIASRLAANPVLSVAIIEAGGFYEDAGNTSVVPAYCVFYAGTDTTNTNPAVDWGFVTTPQTVSGLVFLLI